MKYVLGFKRLSGEREERVESESFSTVVDYMLLKSDS